MNWKEILNMDYPNNILYVLGIENANQDQIQGFYYTVNNLKVKDSYKNYLHYRFFQQMTLQEIGHFFNVSKQSVDIGIKNYLQKIRNSEYWPYIFWGYNKYIEMLRLEEEKRKQEELENEKRFQRAKEIELHKNQKREKDIHRKRIQRKMDKDTFDMKKDIKKNGYFMSYKIISEKAYNDLFYNHKNEISSRLFNAIHRCFVKSYDELTIGDVLELIKENPYWYKNVRNMGRESIIELYNFLYNLGYLTKFEFDYLLFFKGSTCKSCYYPKEKEIVVDMDYWYNNDIDEWG